MSTPTIIRHAIVADGFYVVVTYTDVMGFSAAVQHYTYGFEGATVLQDVSVWSTEQAAMRNFNRAMRINES